MRLPIIPTFKFEGKAVLVLEDGRQFGSQPLGFVEKCPLIAVGQPFLLPNGEDGGIITEVDYASADNELVASCSFKTDKLPFRFKVHADAREVATYYQRTWRKRFDLAKKFVHHLEIVASEEVLGYGDIHLNKKIAWYPFYERSERYTEDAFKTFLEEYRSNIQDGRTMYIYAETSSVEATTRVLVTKDEARDLIKKSKRRWYKSYIDSSSLYSSWKKQSLKVTKRPRG